MGFCTVDRKRTEENIIWSRNNCYFQIFYKKEGDIMSNKTTGVSNLQQNQYSVFSIFCLIYCSASAGAFGVEEIVSGCGPGMCIGVLIGMALVWGMPVVLGSAELSSVMPGEGGYYYWAKHTLGEFWGYIMGINIAISFYVCSSTYVVLAVNYLTSVDHWELWSTDGSTGVGFAAVMALGLGKAGKIIFVVIAVVSALSIFNTNMAGGARSFFVMADDSLFPRKWITNVSKKRGVPYVGVISISIVTLLMMEMEFKALVLIQVIPIFVCQALVSVIILKARRDIPAEERIGCYTVGGGKLGLFLITFLPALICVVAFYLNGMDYFIGGLVCAVIAAVLYIIARKIDRKMLMPTRVTVSVGKHSDEIANQ